MSVVNPSHVQKPLDSEADQRQSCNSKPVLESHLVLLRTCEFSDVTFIVGKSKERIPCHQLFLKARSPVFKAMFSERWNQEPHQDIPLEQTDPKIFQKFLEFIYADMFEASVSEALELLQVAQKYDVQLLVSKCEQVLDSPVMFDDAIDVYQVARKFEMTQLMNKVWDLMAQSLSHLQFLPSFSRMDKRTLTDLLQSNDLKMTEVDLFRLAMKWASNQQDSLVAEQSHIMEDVLPLIRFPLMSLEEFTRVVVPTGLLSQSALIQVFTYFGTDTETKKTLASKMNFSTQQRAVDDNGKVALYSAGFTNCPSRQQKYMQLRENLWFEVGEILDVGLLKRELQEGSSLVKRRTEEKKKHVFMFTISLYYPRTTASINSGTTSSLTKRFHIEVTSHNVDTEKLYRTFCEQKDVEIEEGNILEVKLELWVPLDSGTLYCISVKESPQRGMHYDRGAYEARDFGDIQKNITTTIGDKCVRFLNIRRNHHSCGFGGTNSGPNMIYKLGLIDMEIKY